jgi:hypothetical protein
MSIISYAKKPRGEGMFEIVVDTVLVTDKESRTIRVSVRRHDLDEYGLVCDFHDVRRQVEAFSEGVLPTEPEYLSRLQRHLEQLYDDQPFWLADVALVS